MPQTLCIKARRCAFLDGANTVAEKYKARRCQNFWSKVVAKKKG